MIENIAIFVNYIDEIFKQFKKTSKFKNPGTFTSQAEESDEYKNPSDNSEESWRI